MRYRFKRSTENQHVTQHHRKLSDSLDTFAKEMWELVYRHPYASGKQRVIHGMAHVTRAAILGRVGCNLMRLAGISDFTEEEIKLIEIALLLHDSGAESDGKDIHDNDNALNVYDYLVNRLSIPHKTAKRVAEAARNKDWTPTEKYHELQLDEKGDPFFKVVNDPNFQIPHNVERLRLAIQFGDGVDYLRTHNPFDISYLQLYQKHKDNELISLATQQLLNEDRRMCEAFHENFKNGDAVCNGSKAYSFVMKQMVAPVAADINETKAPCMCALYEGRVTQSELQKMFHRGKTGDAFIDAFYAFNPAEQEAVLYRGINQPNKFFVRAYDTKSYGALTKFSYERYKIDRKPGGESLSRKNKTQKKTGNPMRSMSFAAPGARVFAGVGLGILMNEGNVTVDTAASKDAGTGYGKKEHLQQRTASKQTTDSSKDIQRIQTLIKEGGGNQEHTELTGTIRQYDAILYTPDYTYSSQDKGSPAIRFIKAVYMQHEINRATGRMLPIYEFSCENSYIKKIAVTPALVVEAFKKALCYVVCTHLRFGTSSIVDLKETDSLTLFNDFFDKDTVPLYENFPADLKAQVLACINAFDNEKEAFIQSLVEKAHATAVFGSAQVVGAALEIMLHRQSKDPEIANKVSIVNALNFFKDTSAAEYINESLFEVLMKLVNKSEAYKTWIREIVIEWIMNPNNTKLAYNKADAFQRFLKAINFTPNEEEQKKVDALVQTDKNEVAIYTNAKNAKKTVITKPAATYTVVNHNPMADLFEQAEDLVDQINASNTKKMTSRLMTLLSDIVYLSRNQDVTIPLQQILKKMKKNTSIPLGCAIDLLFFALKNEIETAIPVLAPIAIPSISEGMHFVEVISTKDINRLDLIELVMCKMKSHKIIAAYKTHLLCLACQSKNLMLVEGMLASEDRKDYVNFASLSYEKQTIYDETTTALDNAIFAMRDARLRSILTQDVKPDEVLLAENEYNRWMDVVLQLLELGATVKLHTSIDELYHFTYQSSDARWALLGQSLLRKCDFPLNDPTDQLKYLHLCVVAGYAPGIAHVLRSGCFLNVINEIRSRNKIYAFADSNYTDCMMIARGSGFESDVHVFNKSELLADEFIMFNAMNCFFVFLPASVYTRNFSYALHQYQKSWLSTYADKNSALACALIDFQFQLIDQNNSIEDKWVAKLDLLWSLIDYARANKKEQFFASEIRHQALKLLPQGDFRKAPMLIDYIFKMGGIPKASSADVDEVDFDSLYASESGVFVMTQASVLVYVERADSLTYILARFPEYLSFLDEKIYASILKKLGETLFKERVIDQRNAVNTMDFIEPCELVALYDACVRHDYFLNRASMDLLIALKKCALQMAIDSLPEDFFRRNYKQLFPLLNHQTNNVPNIREWLKSKSTMKSTPSTQISRLAYTLVRPYSSPLDRAQAIQRMRTILQQSQTSAAPISSPTTNNKR